MKPLLEFFGGGEGGSLERRSCVGKRRIGRCREQPFLICTGGRLQGGGVGGNTKA